ncbi:hypothetical protein [Streptomyces sp. NPDC048419]|uniref:hypothetical protein n=1 Tax=Streptomyces sp. NPDC048419 TaxID=3365547 RepID=UPI003719400F
MHARVREPAESAASAASVDRGDDRLSVHCGIALEYGPRFNAMRRERAAWAATRIE